MAIFYSDLTDIMLQRMERLGLVDEESGQSDAAEAELYLFQALLDILEIADIPAYMHDERALAITTTGKADYPLPENFGRLILPRVQNRRGFYLYDGVGLRGSSLEYLEPPNFTQRTSVANDRPTQFTILQRSVWLFPSPDNGEYVIRGTYIINAERPELSDPVLLPYPTALVDVALYRLGSDMGKDVTVLAQLREEALSRLVRGSR